MGSSPRMRGSLLPGNGTQCMGGIIPAHAGLTPDERFDELMERDHPRACGAHFSLRRLD